MYKIVNLNQDVNNSIEAKEPPRDASGKRSRSRKPEKPNHMSFKFDPHDFEKLDHEDDDDADDDDDDMMDYGDDTRT